MVWDERVILVTGEAAWDGPLSVTSQARDTSRGGGCINTVCMYIKGNISWRKLPFLSGMRLWNKQPPGGFRVFKDTSGPVILLIDYVVFLTLLCHIMNCGSIFTWDHYATVLYVII